MPPKIWNLEQKINDSKPHICILPILHYAFAQKISLILRTSTHSILQKLYSRNTASNLNHFTNVVGRKSIFLVRVRKSIFTAPFLDAQKLHSRSTWKANVCTFLCISIRKYLFKKCRKLLFGEGLNNFLKAGRCVGLVKCSEIFHFNWYF